MFGGRESFKRYGVWGEFDEPYLTLLPKYEAAQWAPQGFWPWKSALRLRIFEDASMMLLKWHSKVCR